jgi:5-methylcytosine-specific restriction endonuclease McrA
MKRLVHYSVEEILPILGRVNFSAPKPERSKHQFTLPNGESYMVRVNTPRLHCLKNNQACVWCGRAGNIFVLERSVEETPHLNLYHFTTKGGYLLMTQDHILPVSKGGGNTLDNLQTMCAQCNQAKGTLTQLQFVLKMTGWRVRESKHVPQAQNLSTGTDHQEPFHLFYEP